MSKEDLKTPTPKNPDIFPGIAGSPDSPTRGWIIGPFMGEGLPKTDDIAVKFETIPEGQVRESTPKEIEVTTMALLAGGKIIFWFEGDKKEYLLEKPGEYLIWSPNRKHKTQALEETVLISIRWPNSK
jgi:hypothetical protein